MAEPVVALEWLSEVQNTIFDYLCDLALSAGLGQSCAQHQLIAHHQSKLCQHA